MRMNVVMAAMAVLASAAAFGAITGSITTENGDTHKGALRWSARDKAYAVTTKGNIELQVKASDVAELQVDKPEGFDAAAAKVDAGQGGSVVGVLEKIVKEYSHLEWDKTAGAYLARAYIDAGDAQKGLRTCEDVISGDPSAAFRGELAPAYWEALLKLGRTAKLESALEKAAKSGDRFSSGSALVKRGDVILAAKGGDAPEGVKKALTDGYLRAALLYRDVPKVRSEALYKTAQCFDRLNQAGRAEEMRTELKKAYPSSPWASK